MQSSIFTVGTLAERFGVRPWQVRRLVERGLLPEPPRVGAYRIFTTKDLPRIEAALRKAGYLPESAGVIA